MSSPTPTTEPAAPPADRRYLVLAVVRPVLTITALVFAYYLLPVDRGLSGWTLLGLVGGITAVIVVLVWQIRVILASHHPVLQGAEALAICIPLFLLVYANVYFLMAANAAGSFSSTLTRTDALYFTVTVFATVGFGDITAVSQAARLLVTGQMVGDLLLLGVALRVVVTAVRHSRQHGPRQPRNHAGGTP